MFIDVLFVKAISLFKKPPKYWTERGVVGDGHKTINRSTTSLWLYRVQADAEYCCLPTTRLCVGSTKKLERKSDSLRVDGRKVNKRISSNNPESIFPASFLYFCSSGFQLSAH